MMQNLRYLLSVFVLVLTACASLGLEPADTFDKKLAYAYGQNTGFRQSTAAAVKQGALSSGEGEAVLKLTDDARLLLDAARMAPDVTKAQTNLTLALAVLTQLQTYLNQRKGK